MQINQLNKAKANNIHKWCVKRDQVNIEPCWTKPNDRMEIWNLNLSCVFVNSNFHWSTLTVSLNVAIAAVLTTTTTATKAAAAVVAVNLLFIVQRPIEYGQYNKYVRRRIIFDIMYVFDSVACVWVRRISSVNRKASRKCVLKFWNCSVKAEQNRNVWHTHTVGGRTEWQIY